MSLFRPQQAASRSSHSLSAARGAATSSASAATRKPTSTYTRKPFNSSSIPSASAATARRVSLPSHVPKTPLSSSSTVSAPPPPPSFDDILPPSPSASSARSTTPPPPAATPSYSASVGGPIEGMSIPPPPLQSFPDESYRSLPEATGSPPGEPLGDWNTSFSGSSFQPFPPEVAKVLMRDLEPGEIEVKPDGISFMPEIRYRKRLNEAFGPGGWGMAPRGESHITDRQVSREWGLVCLGRLVSVTRGESDYFDKTGINKAHESAKSNASMRCCKDLGIAAESWDPTFIRKYKAEHVIGVWAQNKGGSKKKSFRKKTDPKFDGAWKE